ncbi:hypothetical protein Dsin_013315 [Dipteronia sinensis]|uniref:Receptor-like serine/threonine-protein kinase n=1 Tax=Dipteronia sinensis TaxID=43782 RepID=A0AAE0AKL1_9ROSI|nr:hypothetical protein Dsin_013315 [Dipteronia sinensis]
MGSYRSLCILGLFVIFDIFGSLHALETITGTQFITDDENESLVSSDGNFKLGFFSPGKSQARYVGIWFNKISEQTIVWVANRETPVRNSVGIFKIADGNLAVFCCNQSSPLWSTNVSVPAQSSAAKLLDSGNLVLVAKETIIWQSFDYPTNTILPGMKFGWNRKTGLNHILTSWKSIDDPTPGEFTSRIDPHSIRQIFLCKNSVPHWRSGPWNGRNMNGLPDIGSHKDYFTDQIDFINITFVNNDNEIYVQSSPKNVDIFSIIVLQSTGFLKRLIWHESQGWIKVQVVLQDMCDEYMRCGPNAICNQDTFTHCGCIPGFERLYPHDWYLKCQETRKKGCGKGDGEGFVRLEGVKFPDARNSTLYSNMSLEECEKECLKSCNCTGYANVYVNEMGRGCIAWYGELRDMRRYKSGQDFYLRVDALELAADAQKNAKVHVMATKSTLVFIIVPHVVETLLAALCFYYLWRRNAKRKGQKQKQQRCQRLVLDSARSLSNHIDSPNSSGGSGSTELTLFELSTVTAATDHFSSANKLGRGGFGPVYKGQLPNGQEIAVKRLSTNSGQGILEFENEVLVIAKLQHRNLIRLLGYCIEKEEKLLIYEFLPNKSLDYLIFADQSRKQLLDWKTRFDIILGITRGILYLHQDSRLKIIHRDLKVSNILLDGEMQPKISDFGTARIFATNETQANTKRVVGTCGYMSIEYALDGLFSMKSDVFSFGVILLEIVSGKKNRGFFHDYPYANLIQYMWELWRDGKALEIVDSCIYDSCPANEVMRCIQVGLLCVQDNAKDRPSMSNVVFMLSNETVLPSPKKSSFPVRYSEPDSSTTTGTKCSNNEVTNTTFDGR